MIEVIEDFFPRRLIKEAYYYLDSYNGWHHLADSPEDAHAYTLGKKSSIYTMNGDLRRRSEVSDCITNCKCIVTGQKIFRVKMKLN